MPLIIGNNLLFETKRLQNLCAGTVNKLAVGQEQPQMEGGESTDYS